MSQSGGSLLSRLVIAIFGACVVAIAGHQLLVKYVPKRIARNPVGKEELLSELKGDIDVAKASVSPGYLEKYARKPTQDGKGGDAQAAEPATNHLDTQALKGFLNKLAP